MLGTGFVEIDGITHIVACGQEPAGHEWWAMVVCDWVIVSITVKPGHVDRLAWPTCLWCVVEYNR